MTPGRLALAQGAPAGEGEENEGADHQGDRDRMTREKGCEAAIGDDQALAGRLISSVGPSTMPITSGAIG